MPRWAARVGAAVAVALVFGAPACGAVDAAKSGGGLPPMRVDIVTAEQSAGAGSLAVDALARRVAAASGGAFDANVRWEAFLGADAEDPREQNSYEGPTEAEVARQVRDGEAQLGVVADFAWIDLGATSLAALKYPFLIDSDELMVRVADELAEPLLTDLPALGVEPLALLPEVLRHPVGFDRPFQSLADFEGRTLRIVDTGAARIFEAIGADTLDIQGSFGQAVMDGTVHGADSAFARSGTLPVPGVFTSDITTVARFGVVVANAAWFAGLSAAQQDAIRAAAEEAGEIVRRDRTTDAEAAADFCALGGTVIHAGPEALEDMRAAVEPLARNLQEEPTIRDLSRQIETLKKETPASPPQPECRPAGPRSPPPSDVDSTAEFPEGSFRAVLTEQAFLDRGIDTMTARNHAGTWTLTFRDGVVWDIECPGSTYTVVDGRISIVLGKGEPGCGSIPGGELFSARWTFDGSVLRFVDIGPGVSGPGWQAFSEVLWGSQDWVKID